MINALTFDVEEYFHAEAFAGAVQRADWPRLESRVAHAVEQILGMLAESETAATFFVLGWVAARHPGMIRMIANQGHEVACHGYGHQMITQLNRSEFVDDVRRAKATVEDACGAQIVGYRAPTFSVVHETLWSLDVLQEAGFRYDSSIFPIVHDRYGIPDAPRFPHRRSVGGGREIVEFPLSTVGRRRRLPVAGGGYFRLMPYAVTRWALRHLNRRERQPAIVYLHPWELDCDQPRFPIGRMSQFRHSVNTHQTAAKLRRLLRDFSFAPARDVLTHSGILDGRAAA